MSTESARKLVLVSMLILFTISIYRVNSEGGSLYKRIWGTGALGVFLSIMADFAPTIAGPFAGLVVLGSLTNGGDKAIQNLLGGAASKVAAGGKAGAGAAAGSTTQALQGAF